MKVAVPDVAQLGKITPPTAHNTTGKVLAHNVATQPPLRQKEIANTAKWNWWSTSVLANPLNIQLSGFPATAVTRAHHVDAISRFVIRWSACDDCAPPLADCLTWTNLREFRGRRAPPGELGSTNTNRDSMRKEQMS
jgi:hypothetical protein